jgi:hypothetical protein
MKPGPVGTAGEGGNGDAVDMSRLKSYRWKRLRHLTDLLSVRLGSRDEVSSRPPR